MAVARLTLTDFRSYASVSFDAQPGLVVLTGENGAGKTNILEAVSLLTPGRGLRQATLSEMARNDGPGGFAVAARISLAPTQGEGIVDIGTGTLATAPERRQVRINGASASANGLSEWLSVLWLTPAMDRLFLEGAGARRRFLDRLVLAREPGHAVHAARYEAAMRARNRLLAEEGGADPAWLAALEAGMTEHGIAIASARERTVEHLSRRLELAPVGPFARGSLAIEGWRTAGEADFLAELKNGRGRDAASGRTLAGPHRIDLAVTHLDKRQPAAKGSTGEQKALLLGIVLAHADLVAGDRGARPILLLDEVAAHLDPLRREVLLGRLDEAGGQAWLTGTELSPFAGVPEGATFLAI
jgi:DNA replication and repair protein RecF